MDRSGGLDLGEGAEQPHLHEEIGPEILRPKIFYTLASGPKNLRFPCALKGFPHLVSKTEGELAEMFLNVRMITKVMNGFVKTLEIIVVAVDSDPGIVSG